MGGGSWVLGDDVLALSTTTFPNSPMSLAGGSALLDLVVRQTKITQVGLQNTLIQVPRVAVPPPPTHTPRPHSRSFPQPKILQRIADQLKTNASVSAA